MGAAFPVGSYGLCCSLSFVIFWPRYTRDDRCHRQPAFFCRILRGEIPARKVYENEHVFAFEDIDPKAPTHVLVIPTKKHFAGLKGSPGG